MEWFLWLGLISVGVVIGIVIQTITAEQNAARWYQRFGAAQGCPVCRIREYDANSAELLDMKKYLKRHGK